MKKLGALCWRETFPALPLAVSSLGLGWGQEQDLRGVWFVPSEEQPQHHIGVGAPRFLSSPLQKTPMGPGG